MSNTSFAVGVRIDGDAAGLAKMAKEAQAQLKLIGAASPKEAQQTQREFARMAAARQTLGIRSEREIQREIARTQAAYGRLARSGTMTWEEQRRAARATREEVTRLTNEMGRYTTAQKAMRAGRFAVSAGVGIGAAAVAVAPAVRRSMEYDLRLSHMTNTAFNERDLKGRLAGKTELDSMIREAVRYGGGTLDSAAETAGELFAANAFKYQDAKRILREAQLAAVANNADPLDFAKIANKANKSMGISADQMGRVFGIGTYAGQMGAFEIRDMAKHLPRQMGSAGSIGLMGETGFAKLAALNQAAINTAGTPDEAGNNVANLLAKIGSVDTAKDFQKLGINLPKKLAEGRMRGLDGIDVVGGLLESQLAKDKNYQNVLKQMRLAKNDADRMAALQSVSGIVQGTVVGKVFQDQQALMALHGYLNDPKYVNTIAADSLKNADAHQRNMDVIRTTPSFNTQRMQQEGAMSVLDTMGKLAPVIGNVGEKVADLAQKYPGYTSAVILATGALGALATSAGALAVLNFAARGKGGLPVPGGIVPTGAAGGPAGSSFGRMMGGAGRAFGAFARAAGPLALIETLTGPSEADIATLRRMDAEARAAQGGSLRGKGYTDPRILGDVPTPTLSDRLGLPSGQAYMPAPPLNGEILVRVTGAPGLQVTTETRTNNPRIPFRTDTGRSNGEMGGG